MGSEGRTPDQGSMSRQEDSDSKQLQDEAKMFCQDAVISWLDLILIATIILSICPLRLTLPLPSIRKYRRYHRAIVRPFLVWLNGKAVCRRMTFGARQTISRVEALSS